MRKLFYFIGIFICSVSSFILVVSRAYESCTQGGMDRVHFGVVFSVLLFLIGILFIWKSHKISGYVSLLWAPYLFFNLIAFIFAIELIQNININHRLACDDTGPADLNLFINHPLAAYLGPGYLFLSIVGPALLFFLIRKPKPQPTKV